MLALLNCEAFGMNFRQNFTLLKIEPATLHIKETECAFSNNKGSHLKRKWLWHSHFHNYFVGHPMSYTKIRPPSMTVNVSLLRAQYLSKSSQLN